MASMWNKTLFYLGLVDEEQGTDAVNQPGVVSQPGLQATPQVAPQAPPPPPPEPYIAPTAAVPPPGSVVAGRRVEPPASTARTISSDRTHAEAGVFIHSGGAPPVRSDGAVRRSEPESQVIVARNFSDAQTLADSIRMGRTVVLDLRSTEPAMVRRIVDFTSGLTYALDGRMAKTAQGVILVTPAGSSLGVGEQERLSRIGLFGSPS